MTYYREEMKQRKNKTYEGLKCVTINGVKDYVFNERIRPMRD